MTCRWTDDPRLTEYLDERLDVEARAEVDAHLESCPACREELRMLRMLSQRAAAIGATHRDANHETEALAFRDVRLSDRVVREVARRRGKRVASLDPTEGSTFRRVAGRPTQLAAAAAVVICSITSGWLGYSLGRQSPNPSQSPDVGPVYYVDSNAERTTGPSTPDRLRLGIDPRTRRPVWMDHRRADRPIDAQPALYDGR